MSEFLCLLGPIQMCSHDEGEELGEKMHTVHKVITQGEIMLK